MGACVRHSVGACVCVFVGVGVGWGGVGWGGVGWGGVGWGGGMGVGACLWCVCVGACVGRVWVHVCGRMCVGA